MKCNKWKCLCTVEGNFRSFGFWFFFFFFTFILSSSCLMVLWLSRCNMHGGFRQILCGCSDSQSLPSLPLSAVKSNRCWCASPGLMFRCSFALTPGLWDVALGKPEWFSLPDVKWKCHSILVDGEDGIESKWVVGFMWHTKELVN